jgi:hypothetical protein
MGEKGWKDVPQASREYRGNMIINRGGNLVEYPSHDSHGARSGPTQNFTSTFMPFFIDSPNPEDDYAARLGRRLQLEVELSTLTFDDVRVFE